MIVLGWPSNTFPSSLFLFFMELHKLCNYINKLITLFFEHNDFQDLVGSTYFLFYYGTWSYLLIYLTCYK